MTRNDYTTPDDIRQRFTTTEQNIAKRAVSAIGSGLKEWEAEQFARRLGLQATRNAAWLRESVCDLIGQRYDDASAITGHLTQRLGDAIAAGQIKRNTPGIARYWLDVLAQIEDGTLLSSIADDSDYQARLKLQRTCEQARDLIRATHGDQADAVLDEVCERLDDPHIPDTIEAVTQFWQDIIAELQPTPQPPTLYDLARQAVEERQRQFPDETVTIWQGRGLRVRVYRSQDNILMDAVNGDPRQAERVHIGYLNPLSGWTFDLDQARYERWAAKAKRLAR